MIENCMIENNTSSVIINEPFNEIEAIHVSKILIRFQGEFDPV